MSARGGYKKKALGRQNVHLNHRQENGEAELSRTQCRAKCVDLYNKKKLRPIKPDARILANFQEWFKNVKDTQLQNRALVWVDENSVDDQEEYRKIKADACQRLAWGFMNESHFEDGLGADGGTGGAPGLEKVTQITDHLQVVVDYLVKAELLKV
ncbi:MAG: hypothetical protein Q9220_001831 [cf. Caloplaca sp. 1 TL-2023]